MTLTLSILTGCKNVSEEAIAATPADSEMETRGVQNWSLWDPLDYYNTGVFNKANWTNGGMFNCGFIPDNAYFQNGKLVLKLNNGPATTDLTQAVNTEQTILSLTELLKQT